VSLRWIRDYDTEYQRDRSLFTTWYGYRHVVDTLVGRDADNQSFISDYELFVRAIKLDLDGTDVLPDPNGDDEKATELGNITGLWGAVDGNASSDATVIPTSTIKETDGSAATPAAQKPAKFEAFAGEPGVAGSGV